MKHPLVNTLSPKKTSLLALLLIVITVFVLSLPAYAPAKADDAVQTDPIKKENAQKLKIVASISTSDSANAALFSPDDSLIAVAGNQLVRLFDVQTFQRTQSFSASKKQVNGIAFSPDGKLVASASEDNELPIWDVVSGSSTIINKADAQTLSGVSFSPDGKWIVSGGDDGNVIVRDTASGKVIKALDNKEAVRSVAVSPDGKTVAFAGAKHTINLWTVDSDTITSLDNGKSPTLNARHLAFSPDGTQLAIAYENRIVELWDVAEQKITSTLRNFGGAVNSVAYSPDGTLIATASDDKMVRLWDVKGRPAGTLRGHTAEVNSVAFSHNGLYLITAGADQVVNVWAVLNAKFTGQPKVRVDSSKATSYSGILPDTWLVSGMNLPRYTVSVTKSETLIENCAYVDNDDQSIVYHLKRVRITIKVTVINFKNNATVGSKAFTGGQPEECLNTEQFAIGENERVKEGTEPGMNEIRTWLVAQLEKLGLSEPK